MKTLVAVPSMDQVPALFAQSLAMLQRPEGDTPAVSFQIGSLIYTSRNTLALRAVQIDATHVFWLDSDMVFDPDTLIRMHKTMEETGADIVTGLYYRRVPPYTPVLFSKIEMTDSKCEWEEFKEVPEEPFEVAACGFGCVLMKIDVLWDVQVNQGNPFSPIHNCGEDIAFCWRARQEGYKILCDPRIPLGHVGTYTIGKAMYESYRKAVEQNGGSNQ